MKNVFLFKTILLPSFLLFAQFTYAQLADGFDIKKAYQQAADKGINQTDIEGYVKYLHNDYLSHGNGHNHSLQQNPGVYDAGTIRLGGNNSNVNRPSSPNSPQNAYCPNAGFEMATFANWTGSYGTVSTGASGAGFPTYNQTSPTIVNPAGNNTGLLNTLNYHTIMTTPATNSVYPNCVGWDSIACKVVGTQTVSEIPVVNPNGGPASVRLNGAIANYRASKLTYNMTLNPNNKNFNISYALVLNNGGHLPNEQPYFSVKITDQNGTLVPGCSVYTVTCNSNLTNTASPLYDPTWTNAVTGSNDIMYRKWSTYAFDFSNYPTITSVNVEFYVGGCSQSGHWGYAYVDAECSQGGAVASFCSGSNTTVLNAPGGYSTYQWTGPSGPVSAAVGGNTGTATITPVTAGQVFTCNVTTSNGCSSIFQTTVSITTVSITGVGSTPSCPNGSSGTTNVTATGSSSGYTYQWLNSVSTIVSTSQSATGLPPGTYSVIVNSPGCGSATSTVIVGNSPPFFYSSSAPYCGSVAWITQTASGSNYKWYTSAGGIIAGATTQTLTINGPINGTNYFLAFTTASGCRDSIKYTLSQTPGGSIYTSNIKSICAGNSNSYAVINLQTTASPVYSYSVTGPSGYSSILSNTSSLKDSVINLSIGTYSATVFDGQCLYNTTFTVSPYVYSYTLTPPAPTICVPGSTTLTVNFGNTTPTICGLSSSGGCTSPNLIQIGTGTAVNSTTGYPAIYGNFYKNTRHQLLYTASELLAAGILPGKISSIAFNITTINGTTIYPNFTIKMKCTSVANLASTTFDNAGLTQVYFSSSANITAGWNTYSFPTAYEWDGVSNLLIDVCDGLTSSYTNNSSSPYTITSFSSVRYYNDDNIVACMTANTADNFSSNRPNIKFGNCGGSNPASFTYSWAPTAGLSSTTSYTAIANPTVSTIYTVQVSPIGQTNCMQARTSTVTVTNPTTPTITAVPALCSNASSFTLSALPTGGTWSLTPTTSTLGVFTPSLAAIGNNTVTYTYGGVGCSQTTTAIVPIEKFVPSTITGTISPICLPSPAINLATALTTSTLGSGVWTGNGVTGTTFDPAVAGSGTHILMYSTNSSPTASLCPSSSTIAVNVNSVAQPTITQAGPFCTNASTLALIGTPTGGTWFGTGISSSGVLTPSMATVGNNTYSYTVGSATCSAVNTTTISIEQYVPSTITGTINPICLPSPTVDLATALTTSTLGTGVWTGNGVTGTTFDPAIAGTGTHTLTYSTNSNPTASLCPSFSVITVNVNSVAQPTITQAGPFCTNASTLALTGTPAGGTWVGTGVSSSGVLTPSLAIVGNNTYSYTVGSATCSAVNSTTISIEQYVPSTITGTINTLCVSSSTIDLATALTTSTLGTGVWTGNGVTGTTFDPAIAGAGTHTLTYSTNSNPTATLCPSFSVIAVTVNSVVQPTITPAGPFCDNYSPQQMSANPTGGVWSASAGSSVTPNGLFIPSPILVGSNKLYYTLTNAPCVKTDSIIVDVIHFVPATITGALGPYCIYDPAVSLLGITQFSGGVWSGSGVSTGSFTPSVAGAGSHVITYITNPSPLLNCGETKTTSILVNPKPEANAFPSNPGGCNYPWPVDFSTTTVNTGIATWNFGDGSPNGHGLMVSHTYTTPGTYIATITYTDNAGCKDTTQISNAIIIFPVPDAAFEPSLDVTTVIDAEIVFNNQTSNLLSNSYLWDFGGLGGSSDVSPTYLFVNSGEYFVTMVAVSPNNCQDTAVKKITINPDVVLYVPNAFTPGNNDGLNDVFQIFLPSTGVDYSTFSLSIYDRWGELVYKTNDVNESWTGAKNNSGPILKQEIFIWKINFQDMKKKYYSRMGHVSLLHK